MLIATIVVFKSTSENIDVIALQFVRKGQYDERFAINDLSPVH